MFITEHYVPLVVTWVLLVASVFPNYHLAFDPGVLTKVPMLFMITLLA